MRALFLLALLPALASAQFIPPASGGGGTASALASSSLAFASHYRATTVTDTVPGYQCDAVLASCVKFGPGIDTSCGTNPAGEVVCGRTGQTTGVWRFWGTAYANTVSATNLTATNVATIKIIQQVTGGYADNPNGTEPFAFNDTQGVKFTCKATLTTCGSAAAPEGTELKICGAAGAKTKKCECTYDGTTYAWMNSYNPAAGVGTATSCPAT